MKRKLLGGFASLVLMLVAATNASAIVVPPLISPAAGTYVDEVDVTVSSSDPGAMIVYTTDGSDPSLGNGYVYSSPVSLFDTTEFKAISIVDGTPSPVTSATFTVVPAPTPTVKIAGKKSFKTKKSVVTIRGTSTDAEEVDYQLGPDGDYKVAKGIAAWSFKAKLKPGKNVIYVYGIGEDEDSDPAKVTITLLKK
jgi:hypothetical protein